MLERFRQLLSRTKEGDRKLLLFMAQKMARDKQGDSSAIPGLSFRLSVRSGESSRSSRGIAGT